MVRESGLGGEARHSAAEVAVDLHDVLDGGGPKERGLDMLLDGTPVVVNPCIVGLHSIHNLLPCAHPSMPHQGSRPDNNNNSPIKVDLCLPVHRPSGFAGGGFRRT